MERSILTTVKYGSLEFVKESIDAVIVRRYEPKYSNPHNQLKLKLIMYLLDTKEPLRTEAINYWHSYNPDMITLVSVHDSNVTPFFAKLNEHPEFVKVFHEWYPQLFFNCSTAFEDYITRLDTAREYIALGYKFSPACVLNMLDARRWDLAWFALSNGTVLTSEIKNDLKTRYVSLYQIFGNLD